jgi:hypothetical protein
MKCTDLLAKGLEGMKLSQLSCPGPVFLGLCPQPPANTPITRWWFANGLGPGFQQIVDSEPLEQLAADEGSGKINLPIGAIILADGHVALFDGVIKVGTQWQLITYDANDSTGWTVSLEGTPSSNDPTDKMISFPGHQVGEHVTRLQWGSTHPVKVFKLVAKVPEAH